MSSGSPGIAARLAGRGLLAWPASAQSMRLMFWVAAATMLPHLFLQYVGEEAMYPIVAQEMAASGNLIDLTLYGQPFGRAGLFSWLILAGTSVLGADHILIVARLISIAATVLMGLNLAWLVQRIFGDERMAAFAAAIFLSGDALLYRGWLAYVDPLYACCTFAAMSCLWVAVAERRNDFLALGAAALCVSFLAKSITGYVFYGALGLVLLWRHENRLFLFRPLSLVLHAAALAFPIAWDTLIASQPVIPILLRQIFFQLNSREPLESAAAIPVNAPNLLNYLRRIFVTFPALTLWYLLPVSAIAIHALVRRRVSRETLRHPAFMIAFFALALNLVPYWLSPAGAARFILPLYPLFALCMAHVVLHAGPGLAQATANALAAMVVVSAVAALIGFPLYERLARGSYAEAAQAVLARAGAHPLYATDDSSVGLSITANLNIMRKGEHPLVLPPREWSSGLVLVADPKQAAGEVALKLMLGGRARYLICRGEACAPRG